jgi:hypothetical protein
MGRCGVQFALKELRDAAVAAELCRHVHYHGLVVVTLDDATRNIVAAGLAATRAFFAHTPPAAKNTLRCKSFQGYTTPKPVRRQLASPSTGFSFEGDTLVGESTSALQTSPRRGKVTRLQPSPSRSRRPAPGAC